jgi:hypothetical protein
MACLLWGLFLGGRGACSGHRESTGPQEKHSIYVETGDAKKWVAAADRPTGQQQLVFGTSVCEKMG